MKVAIIGAGSWGTALAVKACAAGNETVLYHRDSDRAKIMRESRKNPDYLKDVTIPNSLIISSDLEYTLKDAQIVLMVTPSQYARATLVEMKPYMNDCMHVVCCSKGLERETGKRMSQVMEEELKGITEHIAILSGPNHAEEIAIDMPAMTVIGTRNSEEGHFIQSHLSSSLFRVYTNLDMIGVELGGTTKNIIALAAGIIHGMNLGDNIMAALLTRGLHEMTRFGLTYGAKRETYAGLAGMGDLIATCMSKNSRNRSAGIKLAQGMTMKEIVESSNMIVEGFVAVLAVYDEAQRKKIDMPITTAIYHVLMGHMTSQEALELLMKRALKDETELEATY